MYLYWEIDERLDKIPIYTFPVPENEKQKYEIEM